MDEPIEAPEPPSSLSDDLVEAIDELTALELRSVIEYARARVDYLQAPISDLIEPADDEEIVRIDDQDIYTIVVKGEKCDEGCADCPHDPHVYVVTIEPGIDGGRHLHWEDLGGMLDTD